MVTFPKVHPVNPGDAITSRHLVSLAKAINARIRSGLGDATYRIAFYADSLFRQIRNPDEGGFLWPSRSEFLEVYQHVDPKDYTWPIAGPGEAEGVNISCVAGEFVFGSESNGTFPEDERLADRVPLWWTEGSPETPLAKWELAKYQRGAFDYETGYMKAPAFDAAREHYQILRGSMSPHGNSYGSFIPTPEYLGNCSGGTLDTPAIPNYKIFFTNLETGELREYDGSCPSEEGHVQFMYRYPPFSYIVGWISGGELVVDVLPFTKWIEGPYRHGNRLAKIPGDHLPRMLNAFSAQFRGTQEQRAEPGKWLNNAFDTQRFFTSQYMLAPARGGTVGEEVEWIYPQYQIYGSSTVTEGTRLRLTSNGQTEYEVHEGFVVASVLLHSQGLVSETELEVLVDGEVYITKKLTDPDPTDVYVFKNPIGAGKKIEVRVSKTTGFVDASANSGIMVELAELMDYKPWPQDHMLVLRLGGCRLDLFNGMDGSGLDEQGSRELGENYFRWGMVLNLRGDPGPAGSFAEINTNAVFDAGRRLFRCVRILRREHLVAYAVEGGNSILWFDRWTFGKGANLPGYDSSGGPALAEVASGSVQEGNLYIVKCDPDTEDLTYNGVIYTNDETFRGVAGVDTFSTIGAAKLYLVTQYLADSILNGASGDVLAGIAPDPDPIPDGQIKWGREYVVHSDVSTAKVSYNGNVYKNGQKFTGLKDLPGYSVVGVAEVYESNGIRHLAEPQNFSNEWMLGAQFKGYTNSESSTWKPDAYADFLSFSDRCSFYPDPISPVLDVQARRHYAYGSRFWLAPEVVPGYRYGLDVNDITIDEGDPVQVEQRINHYKSCRIYEPDVEIDRTELVWENGTQLVKVTMKGRLHHTDEAEETIDRDVGTWDVDALRVEPYRTTENAIREYLVYKTQGINCVGGGTDGGHQVGNSAWNSPVWGYPDNPFGACFPHFFLTQLLPMPFIDTNDKQDFHDSPFIHDQMLQAEMYIRAMCEGYIDGKTTTEYGCEFGIEALFDYTFENLCFDAIGQQWFPLLPSQVTPYLKARDTRPDHPQGFGPLPNTLASAEVFNAFANAVNKLDKVRVMLPYLFETREVEGVAEVSVGAYNPDGSGRDCETSPGFPGIYWKGTPADATATTPGAWAEDTVAASGVSAQFKEDSGTTPPTFFCDGTQWIVETRRSDYDFRWKLANPDALNAVPETWSDMLETYGGFLAKYEEGVEIQGAVDTDPGTDCLGTSNWWNISIGHSLSFPDNTTTTVSRCEIWSNSGRVHAPSLRHNTIATGWIAGVSNGPCQINIINSATLVPFSNDGILLQIPVVETDSEAPDG